MNPQTQTTTTSSATNVVTLRPDQRTCAHCEGPIAAKRRSDAKFCHPNCSRKASYQRKSPEERFEINKRSNDRRFEFDLLPILRNLGRTHGDLLGAPQPLLDWVVMRLLLEAHTNWRWGLALNYQQSRDALAEIAGGHDQLERIEEEFSQMELEAVDHRANA